MTIAEFAMPGIFDDDLVDQYGIPADRLRDAVEKARDAFWASIAESFPEVETGDMMPGDDLPLEVGGNNVVLTWLMWNHPQSVIERNTPA